MSDTTVSLMALTMIDPASGWFEIVETQQKQADIIANLFEQTWLNQYPWPQECVLDRGSEFMGEVSTAVHTTNRATPSQLVFGRDAMVNTTFVADWQYIKERKQRAIRQNNARENTTRKPHVYQIGDRVTIKRDPNCKYGEPYAIGPATVTRVNDNHGTVKLQHKTQMHYAKRRVCIK